MGAAKNMLRDLAEGRISLDEAVAQVKNDIDWQQQPASTDGYDPEPTVTDSWEEVEVYRRPFGITSEQYDALKAAHAAAISGQ
jgi:hypothetical protein